jgi:hypothetical protein
MKFLTLSMIVIGWIMIFNLGGVTTPISGFLTTFVGDVGDIIDNPDADYPLEGFFTSPVWLAVIIIATVAAAGAIIGSFARTPPESFVLGNIILSIIGFGVAIDLVAIGLELWTYGEGWLRAVSLLIFAPLALGYIYALINFWRGTDS